MPSEDAEIEAATLLNLLSVHGSTRYSCG